MAGISKPGGYRRQEVRAKYGQEIYLLRLPFQVSSMYKSDLRLVGVSKLRGYCRQVRVNAARKFTSWDFPFGFCQCMSPIWDRPRSWNSKAIADKSGQMRPGNLPPETSLSGFVDAWVRSEICRGLETPRLSPTSPHKCGQEIYLLRLTSLLFFIDAWVRSEISRGLETPRLSPTSPHECGQEIYHLRLPFLGFVDV